jgi:high-affinity Fe2+/Pb2+ permease
MYRYLKTLYPAIIGSITLIVGVEMYQRMMAIYNIPAIGMLVSSALIGIIVYVLVIRLSFNNLFKEMKLLIHEIRR